MIAAVFLYVLQLFLHLKVFSEITKSVLIIFFVIFIYLVLQGYLKQMGVEENFRLVF